MDLEDFEEYLCNLRQDLEDEGRPEQEIERIINEEIARAEYEADCAYERQKEEGVLDE